MRRREKLKIGLPARSLTLDSPPEDKLRALQAASETFNSDLTQLVGRDNDGKLLFVSVYARGEEATRLLRFLEKKAAS
jgi:hypothetical protein